MHLKNQPTSIRGLAGVINFTRYATTVVTAIIATVALSIATPIHAADSAADAALKTVLQKRLLVPEAKNLELGPPSPGPFPGMSSRTVTLLNPQTPGQKVELEIFTDEAGKKVIALALTVPRGHVAELRVFYAVALPPGARYDLIMQKQAGIPDRPTTFTLSYPGAVTTRKSQLDHDEEYVTQW